MKTKTAVAIRPDAKIVSEVWRALKLDPNVPEDCLDVRVRDGMVTLSGAVDWNTQRETAELCAKRITGVHGVNNLITIAPKAAVTESW